MLGAGRMHGMMLMGFNPLRDLGPQGSAETVLGHKERQELVWEWRRPGAAARAAEGR